MALYYCYECEKTFDEPAIRTSTERLTGFAGDNWIHEEHFSVCPYCGDEDIDYWDLGERISVEDFVSTYPVESYYLNAPYTLIFTTHFSNEQHHIGLLKADGEWFLDKSMSELDDLILDVQFVVGGVKNENE